jgi:elongation factor 1-beta
MGLSRCHVRSAVSPSADVQDAGNLEKDTHINAVSRGPKRGKAMAEVMVTVKIMPESPEVDMDSLSSRIGEIDGARLNNIEKEPIAFGLVALLAAYVVEDSEGTADNLENAIRDMDDVQSAEVVEVTRLL